MVEDDVIKPNKFINDDIIDDEYEDRFTAYKDYTDVSLAPHNYLLIDNDSKALRFLENNNAYLTFDTTNSAEKVVLSKSLSATAGSFSGDVTVTGNVTASNVTNVTASVVVNTSAIANITGSVLTNASNITNLVGSVNTNISDIIAVTGSINTNASAITNVTASVVTNASTISNVAASVATNIITIGSNTTHRTSDGTDHSYIDQSVVSGADVVFGSVTTEYVDVKSINPMVRIQGSQANQNAGVRLLDSGTAGWLMFQDDAADNDAFKLAKLVSDGWNSDAIKIDYATLATTLYGAVTLGSSLSGVSGSFSSDVNVVGSINNDKLTASKPVFTDASKNLVSTGTLTYDQGGTGQTTFAQGDIIYASSSNVLAKLAKGTDNHVLKMNGNVPNWESEASGGNANYYTEVFTITGSGGDVTITIPFDWTDGHLIKYSSTTSGNWINNTSRGYQTSTSYDALTNASYTDHEIFIHAASTHNQEAQTLNYAGNPKSATTTTIVFDDDGSNTNYNKAFVWA